MSRYRERSHDHPRLARPLPRRFADEQHAGVAKVLINGRTVML
jgi:hypothetical protein